MKLVFGVRYINNGAAEKLVQPVRWKIYDLLRKNGPSFVEEIARQTKVHPRLVSHHLTVLEDEGLIECRYEISSVRNSKKGVAVRMCKTTERGDKVLQDLKESIA